MKQTAQGYNTTLRAVSAKRQAKIDAGEIETKPRAQLNAVGAVKKRQSTQEKAFKAEIRQRDGHRCKRCGGLANEVHHLFTVGAHIELQFTHANCILLCAWCHRLDGDAAHKDLVAFRRWAMKEFPAFSAIYDVKTDRPIFRGAA